MTARGEELLAAIKGVRNFFGDLSQLLVAGDGLLAERSWEPTGDANCLVWLSYSVYKGQQWMPRVAYRRYTNEAEFPCVLGQIVLLLDDHDMDYRLTEPVISASYFVFPESSGAQKQQLRIWHARWFGYRSPPLDGTPFTMDQNDPGWEAGWGWQSMQVFGRPLVEVTSQQQLKEMITDPLLQLITEHTARAEA